MGKPKFSRKKYETPSHPWQEDRIKKENELVKKYGLKNKREVWRAETVLRKYRGQARELLAKIRGGDTQTKKEGDQLLMHLTRLNILQPNSTLDDVLTLETESVLSRRLQTLTYLKGLASTPKQARQLIAHGHVAISSRKITVPGYMVKKDEDDDIEYVAASPLTDELHPARPRADFRSIPIKEEREPEKQKEEKPAEPSKEETKEKEKPAEKTEEKPETAEEPPKEEKKPPVDKAPKEKKPAEETPKEESGKPEKAEEKPGEPQSEPSKEEPGGSERQPKKPGEKKAGEEKAEVEDKSEDKEGGG